jgi:hypothetical protein
MSLNRMMLLTSCTAVLIAACGTDRLTSADQTASALEEAQSDFCALQAAAEQCRAAFDACVLAAGADTEACRQGLHDCLPRPPERGGPGGHCEGMGPGDGGLRPEGPPPGFPGAPPPGGPGPGGHRGPPRGPHPDPAAIEACRTALSDCLAASPGDVTCLETEHTCVRDAFRAAFDAACADAAAGCTNLPPGAPPDACARLQQRCAEGVDGRRDGDGGVCTAPGVP